MNKMPGYCRYCKNNASTLRRELAEARALLDEKPVDELDVTLLERWESLRLELCDKIDAENARAGRVERDYADAQKAYDAMHDKVLKLLSVCEQLEDEIERLRGALHKICVDHWQRKEELCAFARAVLAPSTDGANTGKETK